MLFFPVFAKLQHRPARQTALPYCSSSSALTCLPQHSNLQPANIPTWLDPKSFPLNSFADPYPLNPVPSILYKKGGRGHFLSDLSYFISHLPYTLPSSVSRNPFCLSLTKTPGVWGYSSHFGNIAQSQCRARISFKCFLFIFLRTLLRFFALSCTLAKLNSFIFNRFRTLCKKRHSGGVSITREHFGCARRIPSSKLPTTNCRLSTYSGRGGRWGPEPGVHRSPR